MKLNWLLRNWYWIAVPIVFVAAGILIGIFISWQSFIVSVVASLIATGLVALWLVKVFRVPSFDLHLDYIRENVTDKGRSVPVLDLAIANKKSLLGFGKEEVNFNKRHGEVDCRYQR